MHAKKYRYSNHFTKMAKSSCMVFVFSIGVVGPVMLGISTVTVYMPSIAKYAALQDVHPDRQTSSFLPINLETDINCHVVMETLVFMLIVRL